MDALHTPVLTPLSKPPPLYGPSTLSLPVELLLNLQSPHRLSPPHGNLPNHHNQMLSLPLLDHREFYNSPLQRFSLYESWPIFVLISELLLRGSSLGAEGAKLRPTGQIQPTAYFCAALGIGMIYIFVNGEEKLKRIIFHNVGK